MTITGNQLNVIFSTSISEDAGSRTDYYKIVQQLSQGTADLQMDLSYLNKRIITATGTPDLVDLAGGNVYTGRSGTALSFVEIVSMLVVNVNTVQQLTIGGSGNTFNTWKSGTNSAIILPPAYTVNSIVYPSFFLINGPKNPAFAVTATTADVLQVASDGGSNIAYYLGLLGRSA